MYLFKNIMLIHQYITSYLINLLQHNLIVPGNSNFIQAWCIIGTKPYTN